MPEVQPTGISTEYNENLIDPADKLLMAALRGGTFRLAVRCTVCGTWLVAPASVRRHMGPRCARKMGKVAA